MAPTLTWGAGPHGEWWPCPRAGTSGATKRLADLSGVEPLKRVAARLRALLSADTDQALVRARASGEVLVGGDAAGLHSILRSVIVNLYASGSLRLEARARVGSAGALSYAGRIFWRLRSRPYPLWSVVHHGHRRDTDHRRASSSGPRGRTAAGAVNNRTFFDIVLLRHGELGAPLRLAAVRLHGGARRPPVPRDHRVCQLLTGISRAAKPSFGAFDPPIHALPDHRRSSGGKDVRRCCAVGPASAPDGRDRPPHRALAASAVPRTHQEELQRSARPGARSASRCSMSTSSRGSTTPRAPCRDSALQLLARRLRKSVRTSDLVARFGGEEFVVAFPRMDVDRAVRRVNELRRSSRAFASDRWQAYPALTLSAGVGAGPRTARPSRRFWPGWTSASMRRRRPGRNRVIGPRGTSRPRGGSAVDPACRRHGSLHP